MAERHRLRSLEMRVPGHGVLRVLLGPVGQRGREPAHPPGKVERRVLHPQPEVGRHEVVPAPAGVDPRPQRPEPLGQQSLHRDVHVLVAVLERELRSFGPLQQLVDRAAQLCQFRFVEQPGPVQRRSVDTRRDEVRHEQPTIGSTTGECVRILARRAGEPAAPHGGHGSGSAGSCSAHTRIGCDHSVTNPSACRWSNLSAF